MSYTFRQNLVSSSKYSIKCPYTMSPIGICVHNTSNNASADAEIRYMISNNNQVSYHFAVDEKEVVQGLPTDRNAWAAGDGGSGNGNRRYIHVEICRSTGDLETFKKCEQNAAEFIAKELKKRGWGIDKVKQHHDFANKNCPHRTRELGWQRFLNMIQSELNKLNKPVVQPKPTQPSTGLTGSNFTVRIKVDSLNIRKSASFDSQVVGSVKKGQVYTIIETKNGLGRLKSGAGWISMGTAYVERISIAQQSKPVNNEYRVKIVNCTILNVRSGAGTQYKVTATVKFGDVYTIVGETNGWLKLKSGIGYISSTYTKKI